MNQLRILHLSDVHFGGHHRCSPEDPSHPRAGFPTLYELVVKDLSEGPFEHAAWRPGDDASNPLIIAVSGDLTEEAKYEEFAAAHQFLGRLGGASHDRDGRPQPYIHFVHRFKCYSVYFQQSQ